LIGINADCADADISQGLVEFQISQIARGVKAIEEKKDKHRPRTSGLSSDRPVHLKIE
jgi:hypothetical protein